MTPLCPKGLIDPILNTRLSGGLEGVDGFPSGHPDLDGGRLGLLKNVPGGVLVTLRLGLLKNVPGGVLVIKVLPASFRPKKVDNETSENV
jgi:hypothetical protein